MPPMPAYYHRPQTLDDIINQTVNRLLDLFEIDPGQDMFTRWQGMTHASGKELSRKTSQQEIMHESE